METVLSCFKTILLFLGLMNLFKARFNAVSRPCKGSIRVMARYK